MKIRSKILKVRKFKAIVAVTVRRMDSELEPYEQQS